MPLDRFDRHRRVVGRISSATARIPSAHGHAEGVPVAEVHHEEWDHLLRTPSRAAMRRSISRLLACPACHGTLRWKISRRTGSELKEGGATCRACGATYPLHRGIAAFFTDRERPEDLWESSNSQIEELARTEPEKVRLLLESPMGTMNPTDLFYRGLILDGRGQYPEAKVARDRALAGSYSAEQRACVESQIGFVRRAIAGRAGVVVDLASGMGALLEALLPDATQHLVATDLSPRVLVRDQAILGPLARGGGLSYLAFDARRTPFADRSVPTMVSYLGLANVRDPGGLIQELRRVVSGTLFAISLFYPKEPGPNADTIRQLHLEAMMYRESALRRFRHAGFKVTVENAQIVRAQPTPKGRILEGATTDSLPVVDTPVEWGTLVAT